MTRKTEEIKIRVTPEEKSAWQLVAGAKRVGLSELIRRTMNAHVAYQSASTVRDILEDELPAMTDVELVREMLRATRPIPIESLLNDDDLAVSKSDSAPTGDVPTSVAPAAVPKRRTEECACGKPTWIYCGECGS